MHEFTVLVTFAAHRLRTDADRRYRKVPRATAVIWKMLLVAGKSFRKLNAPELLEEVWNGARFQDGERANNDARQEAA